MTPNSNAAAKLSFENGKFDSSNQIAVTLKQYFDRFDRLTHLNELYSRLASAIDLPGMVESFSVWLMQHFEHNLLAYDNPKRGRRHLFCSCHGPDRSAVSYLANRSFDKALKKKKYDDYIAGEGHNVCRWRLESPDGNGLLVLIHKKRKLGGLDSGLMDEALSVLNDALQRALNYEDLFDQARQDALTGLANRRVFEDRIHSMVDSARRHGYPLTLVSMDLDGFKKINDTFGHTEGDDVLRRVAMKLAQQVRSCDLLVRMGGDEFLLVLPDTGIRAAKVLTRRLRNDVRNLNIQSGAGKDLDVSIGLSQWKNDLTLLQWLERADRALYEDKVNKRNRRVLETGAYRF